MKMKNKRLLSFVLSLVLILAMLPMTAMAATKYCVAGDFMTPSWDPGAFPMDANEDGTYSITFEDVAAGTCSFKVTNGTWGSSWGKDGGSANFTFDNSKIADVTITFDPTTKLSTVTGEGVGTHEFKATSITALGDGKNGFLNNEVWKEKAASNHMENSEGVWSITYTGIPAGTYKFKFVANDSWTDNWGQNKLKVNEWADAWYNSTSDASFTVAEDNSTVTLYLDLTGFDSKTNLGAKMKVGVNEGTDTPDPVEVDYYLFGYINEANYACEEDWENLGEYKFVDGSLVATFEKDSYVAVKTSDNKNWYLTDEWLGTEVTSAILTTTAGENSNKLFVPGGVEVTFTLVDNGDNTFTLSYEKAEVEEPLSASLQVNGSTAAITQTVGTSIKLEAVAAGGSGEYTYKFAVLNVQTGTWFVLQNFANNSSYTSELKVAGTKQFVVTVKDSTGATVATNRISVTVKEDENKLSGSLQVNGSTAEVKQVVGTSVTMSAVATGGSGEYTYKFAVYNEDTKSWFVLKDNSTDPTYVSALKVAGAKQFAVTIKDSTGKTVSTNRIRVVAEEDPSALKGSLQVNGSTEAITATVGSKITLNAVATGGSGEYTYKFAVFNEETGKWFILQNFGDESTYTSALKVAGGKQFAVTIKDSTGRIVSTNRICVTVVE